MPQLTETQQNFVNRYAPYANLASQQLGLPSRVILAKLALETGYGQNFANNNLPGLKTGNAAQNAGLPSAQTATWEDYGGKGRTNIRDGFIRYPTPEQSIGGLVPWLSNSTYMNNLADRRGGGILDRDAAAESAAVDALGKSGFSTDRNASRGVTAILDLLPDLGAYGIAPSFDPAVGQLMNYVPYNGATGQPNVSTGLGQFADYNYRTGTRFQPEGVVLPRERGATGIELPMNPAIAGGGAAPGGLDAFSDAITGGLEGIGRGIGSAVGGAADAIGGLFGGSEQPAQPAPGDYDFGAGKGVSGGVDKGTFGGAGGVVETGNPFGFGGDVSGGVPNGSLGVGAPGFAPPSSGPGDALGVGRFTGFDRNQYLQANQDVAASGQDPIEHFLRYGAKENRALTLDGTRFDSQAYLAANQDVARSGMDAIDHYLRYGAPEGRLAQTVGPGGTAQTAGPLFTGTQLPSNYAQLVQAGFGSTVGPGATAGTQGPGMVGTQGPSMVGTQGPGATASTQGPAMASTAGVPSWFNAADYFNANGDVKASGQDAFSHFKNYGAAEGRALNLDGVHFGSQAYLAANPDVAGAGMSPVQHYLDYGQKEGRASPLVDNDSAAADVGAFGFSGMSAGVFGAPAAGGGAGGGGPGAPAALPPPGFLSEAQQTSQRSQDNVFAIQANDARNSAAAQDAAAQNRNNIGVGAQPVFFTPQVFNPGAPVTSNQPLVAPSPMITPPPMSAPILSSYATPRMSMSGFR